MSGIALLLGGLLVFAIIVGPFVLIAKLLGTGARVSATLFVAQTNGTLVRPTPTQARLHARALESQRRAAAA